MVDLVAVLLTIMQQDHLEHQDKEMLVELVLVRMLHLMAAAVINIVRLLRWLAGEPKAQTRLSPFARLYEGAT